MRARTRRLSAVSHYPSSSIMSTPVRPSTSDPGSTLESAGPSTRPAKAAFRAKKRVLSEDESSDRDVKRAKTAAGEPQGKDKGKDKEKKKRRKKKRKQPVAQGSAVDAVSASAVRERSRSPRSHAATSQSARTPDVPETPVAGPSQSLSSNTTRRRSKSCEQLEEHSLDSSDTMTTPSPKPPPSPPAVTGSSENGKARPPDDPATVATLTAQLAAHTELLKTHATLFSTLTNALTCQICLEPLHRPFALAPCGHTACAACLAAWFTAPPGEDAPPGGVLPPLRRRKTCPHCRARVVERPVEVWAIKDAVGAVVRAGIVPAPPADAEPGADPWDGIFPKPPRDAAGRDVRQEDRGILDAEDGGVYRCVDCMHEIWGGVCAECGRVYPAHPEARHRLDDFYGDDNFADEDEDVGWGWGLGQAAGSDVIDWNEDDGGEDDYSDEYDDEDGGAALFGPFAELWGNFARGAMVHEVNVGGGGANISDEEGEQSEEAEGVLNVPGRRTGRWRVTSEDEEDEEGYESSFIDDGDAHPVMPDRNFDENRDGDDEDEDDDEEIPPVRLERRVRTRVVESDSDANEDDEEDPHETSYRSLADLVAQRERDLYGDDGSVARCASDYSDYGDEYLDDDVATGSAGQNSDDYDYDDGW
ncbi:hypothetical protein WOLCODRAFT_140902 [Wolfiporia cocos MD-104 SS10]|uniref:RING-type domain-containing protein n=1 Tax=Wolfiporia cocos (strain MD-104) TaxID=742152 RepID=A0A2H3J6G4_WOLCO|nr:hypothetical protein WOLCODRAFT_140902 [Wolfiporia cocos MD-104 SS10]